MPRLHPAFMSFCLVFGLIQAAAAAEPLRLGAPQMERIVVGAATPESVAARRTAARAGDAEAVPGDTVTAPPLMRATAIRSLHQIAIPKSGLGGHLSPP